MTCETTDMTRGAETTDNPWQREEKEANAFFVSMSGFPLSVIRRLSDPSTPDKVLRSNKQMPRLPLGMTYETLGITCQTSGMSYGTSGMTCKTTGMTRGTETTYSPWQREGKEANAFFVSMSGFPLSVIRRLSDPSTPDKVLRSNQKRSEWQNKQMPRLPLGMTYETSSMTCQKPGMTCETTDMTRGTETTDNPWQREEKEANAFLLA